MTTFKLPTSDRRRRRGSAHRGGFGMSGGELAMLRGAVGAVIAGLNDRQLRIADEGLRHYLDSRREILEIDDDALSQVWADNLDVPRLRALGDALGGDAPSRRPALDRRIGALAGILGLDADETTVLTLLARLALYESWQELARQLPMQGHNPSCASIALLTGLPVPEVDLRLASDSRLIRSGMVRDDGDGEFHASSMLQRIARSTWDDAKTLRERLTPAAPPSTLAWEEFAHLGALPDLAARVIGAGEPVSLLLHGAPGTGKSEFARALAQRCGRKAVFAGLADERGGEPDRRERLDHLALLRALSRGQADTLVVVDEADDVLRLVGSGAREGSKLWRNLLVECPQVATVWILNDPGMIDPALVRRMTLALQFELPPAPVRERVARRAAETQDLPLTDADIRSIGALEAEPAIVAAALRAAKLAGGGVEEARLGVGSVLRALGRSTAPAMAQDALYDAALAAANVDLAALADRLVMAPAQCWSLLLSGPSGTGKSAYARHLAQRMGLEVEDCRGADLLSPYVGGTEAKIARAFERAGERGAMLLIDEADSFLFRREPGQRSWETGMVNEMLRAMERLTTPFVATTNLAETLDPAMQRRFTLRAAFRPMGEAQAARLFVAHFGAALPQGMVLSGQTPGDFAVIARRAQLLGETRAATLAHWLREEALLRGETVGRMGF